MKFSEIDVSNVYCNLTGDRVDFTVLVDGEHMDPDDHITPDMYVDPVWGRTPKGNSTVVGLEVTVDSETFTIDAKMVRKLKLQHLCSAFKRASQLVNQDEDRREMDPDSYMEMQDYQSLVEYSVSQLL
jgi:hypothetical protein